MIYLFCSILFTTGWALSYKIASRRNCDLIAVNIVTYLSATLMALLYFLFKGGNFNFLAVFIGLMGGAFLFIAVLPFFYVVKQGEVGISWTIVSLSVIIPVFFSIFLWQESPDIWQILGLILVVFSLILLGKIKMEQRIIPKSWIFLISFSFLFTGLASLTLKMFYEFGLSNYKGIYVLSFYGFALFLITVLAFIKKRFPHRKEFLVGWGMGTSGILNTLFMLLALRELPGIVVFPILSSGNVVLTVFLSYIIWKEDLTKKSILGIIIAVLAIAFINI